MKYEVEVKKDLWKVIAIIGVFAIILVGLKLYDAKTNEIALIGNKLLSSFVK